MAMVGPDGVNKSISSISLNADHFSNQFYRDHFIPQALSQVIHDIDARDKASIEQLLRSCVKISFDQIVKSRPSVLRDYRDMIRDYLAGTLSSIGEMINYPR